MNSFAHFRLDRILGEGQSGVVYEAMNLRTKRPCALKKLKPVIHGDDTFITRFERECRVSGSLRGRGIVQTLDYGIERDCPWIEMQLVKGGSLEALLKTGKPSVIDVLEGLADIAKGLDYAHDQKIIHRDVKPGNILLHDARRMVLGDFGLAKLATESLKLTKSGTAVGTVNYMAPEQAEAQAVTKASDIYSLGVVTYQVVCNRLPFVGATDIAVMWMHVRDKMPPVGADVPLGVQDALEKALAKNPDDRWTKAWDLSAAVLDAYKTGRRWTPAPVRGANDVSGSSVKAETTRDSTVLERTKEIPVDPATRRTATTASAVPERVSNSKRAASIERATRARLREIAAEPPKPSIRSVPAPVTTSAIVDVTPSAQAHESPEPENPDIARAMGRALLPKSRLALVQGHGPEREITQLLFRSISVDFECVDAPEELGAALRRRILDYILIDCSGSVKEGLSLVSQVQASISASEQRPFLFVMSVRTSGDQNRRAFLAAGIDDVVFKPLTRGALERLLLSWVGKIPTLAPTAERYKRIETIPEMRKQEVKRPGISVASATTTETPIWLSTGNLPHLDEAAAQGIQDSLGDDFEGLLHVSLAETSKLISELGYALKSGHLSSIVNLAFDIKATSASVGALELSRLAQHIELDARAGQIPGALEMIFSALRNSFHSVINQLVANGRLQ